MKGIADTGFLVACVGRRDRYHKWAAALLAHVDEPLITCEAVLAETAFHLGSASATLELVATGLVRPDFDMIVHLSRLAELAARYRDRSPDLADLCLIRMSELHPKLPILTTDVKDFRVYRRNRREAIPLIVPGAVQ